MTSITTDKMKAYRLLHEDEQLSGKPLIETVLRYINHLLEQPGD